MAQESRGTDEGGMYAKQETTTTTSYCTAAATANSHHVCFVCGNSGHPDQYWLRVRPSAGEPSDVTPYFPFLEMHEPPQGYRQPLNAKQESANSSTSCT